jgi:hypothetical protein
MNEPAEDVSPSDSRASYSFRRGGVIRRSKVDAPMRPGPVVVLGVRVQDVLQVAPAEDQHVVEAFSSNGADPTLRERVCPGCPDGRLHDAEALGTEDLVERPGELGVSVPDEELLLIEASGDRQVRACWVTQAESGFLVTPARCTRLVESSMKNRT